jgi:diguanylate cyclase (GGDEF)-like protein
MAVSVVTLAHLFLLGVTFVLLFIAFMAWRRRKRASEGELVCLLAVLAAIYCFGYSGEVVQSSLAGAFFWLHIEYLGVSWIPALWVWLARKHNHLRTPLGLLLVIPAIAFLAEWTNAYHGLFDRSAQLLSRPPFWVVSVERGPIAWLFLVYLYGALLYGDWVYISRFRSASRLFRKQSLMFVGSSLPPLLGYLVYFFNASPWGLDLGPVLLSASSVLAYLAIIRLECFDLVPMARSLVFNSMRDAALVTDLRYQLVDFNPAARRLMPFLGNIRLGNDVTDELRSFTALRRLFDDPAHAQKVELQVAGEQQNFEVRALPLLVEGRQTGWALLWANVTAQVRQVHELRRNAETDELTGVANRRCFMAAIDLECERATRHQSVFSVMIVDIDHFKSINDGHGHAAGDRVLVAVAARITACLRRIDLLSRFGGDEFAILLPETEAGGACEVAERIRAAIAGMAVEWGGKSIQPTVSIGLAAHDLARAADGAQLLDEADQALYRAKAAGRNRAACWDEISSIAR